MLFSVHKNIRSSSVSLDKNNPLIYGPIVESLTFCTKSPSIFKIPKHPSFTTDLNSNNAATNKFDADTVNDVGPNRPLN